MPGEFNTTLGDYLRGQTGQNKTWWALPQIIDKPAEKINIASSFISQAPQSTFWQKTKEAISNIFEPVTTFATGLTPRERAEVVPIQAQFRQPFEEEAKPLPWAKDSILNVSMIPSRIASRTWEGFTQIGLNIEQTAIDLYHIIKEPSKELPSPISTAKIGGITEPTGLIRGYNNTVTDFDQLQQENNQENNPLKTFVNTQIAYYKNLAGPIADFLIAGDLINLGLKKLLTPLGEKAAQIRAAEELGYPKTIREAQTNFNTIAHETSELGRVGIKNRTLFERANNAYEFLKKKGIPSQSEIRTVPPIRNIVQNLTRNVFEKEIPLEATGAIRAPTGYLPGYKPITERPTLGLRGLEIEPLKPVGFGKKGIIPPLKTKNITEPEITTPKEIYAQYGNKELKKEIKPLEARVIEAGGHKARDISILKPTEELKPLTPQEEAELSRLYSKEFGQVKEAGERKLFKDIKELGGLKTDPTLKEEMSDLPIDIIRTTGQMPDEIIAELNGRGYNFQSGDDLIQTIKEIRTMPSRYKVAESNLEKNIKAFSSIRTKMPKVISESAAMKKLERVMGKIMKGATVPGIPTKTIIKKITGIKPEERPVVTTEMKLLRAKIRSEARGAKIAVKQYRKEQAFLENISRKITIEINKPKGTQRSVISFAKQLGEFNQTVINEIKTELGITKPLKNMNLEELKNFTDKIKERLRLKFEKGYQPSVETKEKLNLKESPKPTLNEVDYEKNRQMTKETKPTFGKGIAKTAKRIGMGTEKLLSPISTRLENIAPSLKYALRKFEFEVANSITRDKTAISPYLKRIKTSIFGKINKDDFADLDLALKNGDIKKINEINKKYGIEKEYEKVRKTLDDIYKRANEVGFDIGYQKDYWPRMIRDTEGFLEYFGKQEYWSILNEAIQRKEMDLGRYLSPEEKANLINTMIRGYQGGQITLSGTGAMKKRVIDLVTPELNKFYYNSPISLVKYIGEVDDKIAARKFFGKGNKAEGFNNIENSIGAYTTDLLAKGKITPKQELELRGILNARFNPRGTHGIVGLYKNLSYIDVMGSFLNAVTQLGDQAWAIYRGGLWGTVKADVRAIFKKSKITKESLGIEAKNIASEFSDEGKVAKAVDKVFTLTGLNKIDRLGKEALVNSAISKYQKLAEKPSAEFLKKLGDIFGKESAQVLVDLKSGEITENVKLLAFNELLDFHPVALSEMPEMYLKAGNGRIFYMLKSYTLKQFDIFRREAFREMKRGNWWKGIRNLLYLSTLVILANGTADEIKDLLTNRKTKLSDRIIDQLAMLAGFSRYTYNRISEVGLGTALFEQITPPTNFIDNLSKDLLNLYKDFDKSAHINKLKTIQDIPLIGKLYYWWFGKGAETTEKYKEKKSVLPELPKLPKLPELPKLPKLPKLESKIETNPIAEKTTEQLANEVAEFIKGKIS